MLKRLTGVVATVVALAGLTAPEGRIQASAPVSVADVAPNVIVYLTDDQTLYSMTAEAMPYLFSEPFGSWVQFDNFFFSTPLCCPSRATMMTGAYAYQVGVRGNTLAGYRDAETLPVWLQRAGYRTGLVGKYLNDPRGVLRTYIPPGWSDWHALAGTTSSSPQDEGDYYNYLLNDNGLLVPFGDAPEDYEVDVLTGRALEFIESTPAGQPFYLQIGPRNPHVPIIPAPRHADLPVADVTLPPNFNEADVTDKPAWVRALPPVDPQRKMTEFRMELRAMRSVDESLHQIVDAVAARGELDSTVIIYATDNGYSRGSHRHNRKICPYEECIRGPLWIRYPGSQPRHVTELVSNIDIAPTIGELAGATATIPQDGVSLVPLLQGAAPEWRTDLLVNWRSNISYIPPYWAVRTEEWMYVEYSTRERELYDLVNDPYQLHNVVRDPARSLVVADMRARLRDLKHRARDRLPSATVDGASFPD